MNKICVDRTYAANKDEREKSDNNILEIPGREVKFEFKMEMICMYICYIAYNKLRSFKRG